jgi:uncharacterized protein YozE (UPF0346 family)
LFSFFYKKLDKVSAFIDSYPNYKVTIVTFDQIWEK